MGERSLELTGEFRAYLHESKGYKTFIFRDQVAGDLLVDMSSQCPLYIERVALRKPYQINVRLQGYAIFVEGKRYTKNSLRVLTGKKL